MNILIKRLLASYIDGFIVIGLSMMIVILTGRSILELDVNTLNFIIGLIYVFEVVYFTILEAKFSRTIGKKILKIKVVNYRNEEISIRQSIIRNIIRIPDTFLIGPVLAVISKEHQRLGDILTKTKVIDL